MTKKYIFLMSAIVFILMGIWEGKNAFLSANIATPPSQKMYVNALDAAQNCSCESINADNEYLQAALQEDGTYHPDDAIALFLRDEDEAFTDRMQHFRGSSRGCELNAPEEASVFDEQKINSLEEFTRDRWEDFQKIDCALQAMEKSNLIFSEEKVNSLFSTFVDDDWRAQKIAQERRNIALAMDVAIMQLNEMASVYPLHEKLVCANEAIAEQRELLAKFAQHFSKLPASYINATSQ